MEKIKLVAKSWVITFFIGWLIALTIQVKHQNDQICFLTHNLKELAEASKRFVNYQDTVNKKLSLEIDSLEKRK